jgi:protease I
VEIRAENNRAELPCTGTHAENNPAELPCVEIRAENNRAELSCLGTHAEKKVELGQRGGLPRAFSAAQRRTAEPRAPPLGARIARRWAMAQKETLMNDQLKGKKIAILATHGFELDELKSPKAALEAAGATAMVVSPAKEEKIKGWKGKDWSGEVRVDETLDTADAAKFDALVLPGGVLNPDQLRLDPRAVAFVKAFVDAGKPIAAICHGPWTLINAGAVRGKKITSWPTLRVDLTNAGANWVDQEVVVDTGLVTSRKPDDLPAFNGKMIETFAEGGSRRRENSVNA